MFRMLQMHESPYARPNQYRNGIINASATNPVSLLLEIQRPVEVRDMPEIRTKRSHTITG